MSEVSFHLPTRATSPSMAGVGDYFALLKPRVMALVVFTALVGMVRAPEVIHPLLGLFALVAIAVGAGAAGALNMWYDADIDALMKRTQSRPIPLGRITREETFTFGMVLAIMAVLSLGVFTNWLAAGLLAFTIFFYVVIYTMWLKRSTPQNIVIGGAAGALPPVIGWAAAGGGIGVESFFLFLIIFLWTPPHFWALSLVTHEDYEKARVPMLPVVSGERATRGQIFAYALLLLPSALAPVFFGMASPAYGRIALFLSLIFIVLAGRIWRGAPTGPAARQAAIRLFVFSIFYLFALFAVLLLERLAAFLNLVAG